MMTTEAKLDTSRSGAETPPQAVMSAQSWIVSGQVQEPGTRKTDDYREGGNSRLSGQNV